MAPAARIGGLEAEVAMTTARTEFDIVIIGAGPAGLALGCALAGQGLAVAVVERLSKAVLADPPFDGREIALTHASVEMLRDLDAWGRITPAEISPLGEACVINGGSAHSLHFGPTPGHGETLGHLVPNHEIRRTLFESAMTRPSLHLIDTVAATALRAGDDSAALTLADGRTLTARLIVAADTRFSEMRRRLGIGAAMRDFGKTMLVCRMAHDQPHHDIATEWFGYGITIAMLPLNGTADDPHVSSLVLTLPGREIEHLMGLDDAAFGAEITRRYEERLGGMRLISSRHTYPLVAVYARRFVADRFALAGDAAVGMHPVTAHGFNFGLTSQHTLAGLIAEANRRGGDIGAPALLRRYELTHRLATRPLYVATNTTALLYTDDRLPARVLRDAVIRVGERLSPVRRVVTAHIMRSAAAHASPLRALLP
jgi:ubiquinone biosynthesis UbiH/UbiF/VisC/COQ6 family hydroxylase